MEVACFPILARRVDEARESSMGYFDVVEHFEEFRFDERDVEILRINQMAVVHFIGQIHEVVLKAAHR